MKNYMWDYLVKKEVLNKAEVLYLRFFEVGVPALDVSFTHLGIFSFMRSSSDLNYDLI